MHEDGEVTGTIKYVEGFNEFNEASPDEQSGNFFPIHLEKKGDTLTLKKNGVAGEGKTDMPYDADVIFRLPDADTTFTAAVDDVDVVTLNFKKATLEKE